MVVFLNTFEKQTEEGRVVSAQVSIGETQGRWNVAWQEEHGGAERTSLWFEGTSWEEMLAAFRHGVAVKMGEGYEPLIDGMLDSRAGAAGSFMTMAQCYGELHAKEDVVQALKEWRRSKAIEEKKAAYLIATNRLLWMISAFLPHTEAELKQIPGWGESRTKMYGDAVLKVTKQFERETAFPLTWVSEKLDPEVYRKWLYKQRENKYRTEMEQFQLKRSILQGVQNGTSLDDLESQLGIRRRELMERLEELDKEGYDLGPLIDRELGTLTEEEYGKIVEALHSVGDRYLKPILKQVYSESELEGKQLDPYYERLRLVRLRYKRISA